ncbi:MAG: hypothetical protein EAZ51_05460 [Sphingobacteriales bacterium]|nr:MAG: hypothetical protein EAZ64_08960 [Sphingobacteriales bacterium]TAF80762.1 MAG: hypothetical protein EAZ51_05460 [Sphingobacteriales bacterium]
MKKLKTLLVAFTVIGTTLLSNATIQNPQEKGTLAYSIETYLNMINLGETKKYATILADDVKFNTTRNGKIITHGKSEELNFIRSMGNVKQNCKTEFSTISTSENFSIIKVKMIYEGFTKENIVSFSKTDSGWKITDVTTVFL